MYREPVRQRGGGPNWMGVSFLLLAVLLAFLGVAIIQSRIAPSSPAAEETTRPPTATESESAEPSGSQGSPGPSASPTPDAPSEPAPSPSAPPSAAVGDASECTGTDNNREFLAAAAEDLAFDVYCPILPEGWGLRRGSYSFRGAGLVDLSYRGPGGATLRLRQGDACLGDDDCPPGEPAGDADFNGLGGELRTSGDDLAIVAEGQDDLLYVAEFSGVDEDEARSIAEAVLRIE